MTMQGIDGDASTKIRSTNKTMKGKNIERRAMMRSPFMLLQTVLLFLAVLASVPTSVVAWGEYGHEMVANVAWARLSPSVQAKVSAMLNITNATLIAETGSPLAAVANWADHVRHFLPWSASLHYIDVRDNLIPGGCHYNDTTTSAAKGSSPSPCDFHYDRDCPADVCVAGAIVNYSTQLLHWQQDDGEESKTRPFVWKPRNQPQQSLLRKGSQESEITTTTSHRTPDNHTVQALKFLIHFIGDIHQPLHASRTSDKGGNDISVKYHLVSESRARAHANNTWDEAYFRTSSFSITSSRQETTTTTAPHHPHHHAWNLHSIWDTALIETALERTYENNRTKMEEALEALLVQHPEWIEQYASCPTTKDGHEHGNSVRDAPGSGLNVTCVIGWGQDSWTKALTYAYTKNEPWKKSHNNEPAVEVAEGDEIDNEYYESRIEIVKEQLIAGGVRLAWTLEEIFGDKSEGNYNNNLPLNGFTDSSRVLSLWATLNLERPH